MQLIKSLRSFGRWLFNIKDELGQKLDIEVKPKDKFIDIFNNAKVHVISVRNGYVYYRFEGSMQPCKLTVDMFLDHHRKIS